MFCVFVFFFWEGGEGVWRGMGVGSVPLQRKRLSHALLAWLASDLLGYQD